MWDRLKALFGGWSWRSVAEEDDPAPAEAAPGPAPGGPPTTRKPARSAQDDGLAAVEAALKAGEPGRARALLGPLLLDGAPDAAVFAVAARLMSALGEPGLAAGFRRAAGSTAPDAPAELSAAFLSMDDAPTAAALARTAVARGRRDDVLLAGLLAEATARLGEHGAVLEQLARFEGRWPDPALLRRYALSAALTGDRERWERVRPAIEADAGAAWIRRAGERMMAFDGKDGSARRHALFVEHGAVLVDAGPVRVGGRLEAGVLDRVAAHVAGALVRLDGGRERVAYVTTRGEVFARWIARHLDTTAIPLSARLQDQRIAVVAADDDDLARLMEHPGMGEGPAVLVQVVKDPRTTGVPAADIVGVLGADVDLPVEAVVAEKAADRTPPRLLVDELVAAARATPAPDPWPGRDAWLDARRVWLLATDPPEASRRVPWVADLPQAALRADDEPAAPAEEAAPEAGAEDTPPPLPAAPGEPGES